MSLPSSYPRGEELPSWVNTVYDCGFPSLPPPPGKWTVATRGYLSEAPFMQTPPCEQVSLKEFDWRRHAMPRMDFPEVGGC